MKNVFKKFNNPIGSSLKVTSTKTRYKRPLFLFFYKGNTSASRVFFLSTVFILFLALIIFVSVKIYNTFNTQPDIAYLETLWQNEDYEGTYTFSKDILSIYPMDNIALTYHGYSSFYLALSTSESAVVHGYIDESINSLRLALLEARGKMVPQLQYMLGKAYFHKNRLSAYYFYADLAIKYLHSSHNYGYNASDIYEYLGLSYASLDMTNESISYFTEALLVNDSDVLQLAIAEQYYKIGNYDAAKPYLQRIKSSSTNDLFIVQCSNLLGQIYIAEENYEEAQIEFESALEKDSNSADAYYGLGLIYENQGDTVRARAQWREALEIEVNHQGARLKMTK